MSGAVALLIRFLAEYPRPAFGARESGDSGELEIFSAWLTRTRGAYGCDEGPARFVNGTVEAAYPGRRFYYVLTHARGIAPPFKNAVSLVAEIDDGGEVRPLDSTSLDTYRRGLKKVSTKAEAKEAAAAVLILALGDPKQRRWRVAKEAVEVKRNRRGWTCTYRHDPNHPSQVSFDRRGLLATMDCRPPPVP